MSLTHSATDAVAVLRFVLPFPPSVNRYYRHVGYRTLLSREGREYRRQVCALLAGRVGQPLSGPLQVTELDLYPPDRRRRDWDNFHKAVSGTALQHAGVYLSTTARSRNGRRRCTRCTRADGFKARDPKRSPSIMSDHFSASRRTPRACRRYRGCVHDRRIRTSAFKISSPKGRAEAGYLASTEVM